MKVGITQTFLPLLLRFLKKFFHQPFAFHATKKDENKHKAQREALAPFLEKAV
jgi:hypothetical protein